MPTIIDSLIVKLGLDSSDFKKGKDEVEGGLKDTGGEAEKTGKKLEDTGKKGSEGFDKTAKSAAKFLALIGGTMAIKHFVQTQIEANSALDRFSQNLGESVSTVSSWSNAAEIAGGSAAGLQGTMDNLSRSQTELQLTGQSGLIPYFSALGMSMTDAHGKAKPVNQLLLDLSGKFSKMDRTTANNMGRMMGIDQGTMQLLLKGRTEVETMIKRQKEYGAVTKQQAEESSRLRQVMVESTQSFNAFGRELLSAAIPYIEKFFDVMKDFGAWGRKNKEFLGDLFIVIAGGLAAMGASAIPINLTAVALGLLAVALAAFWQDYQTFKKGGDTLIPWAKWKPGIDGAIEGLGKLREIIKDISTNVAAAVDGLTALSTGDWDRAAFAGGEIMTAGKSRGLLGDIAMANPLSFVGSLISSEMNSWNNSASTTGGNSSQTRIDNINVYANEATAPGVAGEIGAAVDYLSTSQANSGMN